MELLRAAPASHGAACPRGGLSTALHGDPQLQMPRGGLGLCPQTGTGLQLPPQARTGPPPGSPGVGSSLWDVCVPRPGPGRREARRSCAAPGPGAPWAVSPGRGKPPRGCTWQGCDSLGRATSPCRASASPPCQAGLAVHLEARGSQEGERSDAGEGRALASPPVHPRALPLLPTRPPALGVCAPCSAFSLGGGGGGSASSSEVGLARRVPQEPRRLAPQFQPANPADTCRRLAADEAPLPLT